MDLSNLIPADGTKHSDNFRRGRGHGSGNGKTAGKGHKGQKARSGATRPGYEGGQMPLYRRIPKRGFKCRYSKEIVGINVSALERFEDGATVSVETMIECGLVTNPRDGVKIIGNGELTKKLTVQANAFSAGAVENKGQKARSGATRPGFEGGQMPLYRRIPKRGFKCRNSKEIVGINVSALERFEDGATVSVETMIECGLVTNPRDGVKILGNGELTKKLTVQANAFSAGAVEKIEALGGKAEVI